MQHKNIHSWTICFETNFESAHELARFSQLISDLENVGCNVNYFAIEIGSWGFVNKENEKKRLRSPFKKNTKTFQLSNIKTRLATVAMLGGDGIFCSKSEIDWLEPALIRLGRSSVFSKFLKL